jgi:hypothetical protein
MASNVVVDATTIASFQSDIASMKQYLMTGQYYYSGRNQAMATSLPLIPSDITNSISVFQATQKVVVSANPTAVISFTPPNPFKNTPIVSAVVECSAPPGAMVPVLLNITPGSYQMDFKIYTFGSFTSNIDAYLHITAISYE